VQSRVATRRDDVINSITERRRKKGTEEEREQEIV
jgi:predicted transposase YdaD